MQTFIIENKNGLKATITNYGGRIMSLCTPDKDGKLGDIVLGYDTPEAYPESNEKYFGATIGRYGNRIGRAKFTLLGQEYRLIANNGENSLHGGPGGFHNVYWDINQPDRNTLEMKYYSKDMEEGFPGNLDVKVIYCLNEENELRIDYYASTDKPTVVNLTHHSFFNLTADPRRMINDHIMHLPAAYYTPVDEGLIPTGELAPVDGTPFDFRTPTRIGARIEEDHIQLVRGKGYDHNWVLDPTGKSKTTRLAARVEEPDSGRVMEVYTNEPGIQFYGGNFLNGKDIGKKQIPYCLRTAFCLETQHFPDSPNKPEFPSTLLMPSEKYHSVCIYRFSTS